MLSAQPETGCAGPCLGYASGAGTFAFVDLPARSFTLVASDPVSGLKGSVGGVLNPGERKTVRVVFSEQVNAGTVNLTNITLSSAAGPAAGTIALTDDDTVATFRPLQPLNAEALYTLRVHGVEDRTGKALRADFVSTFTTLDI